MNLKRIEAVISRLTEERYTARIVLPFCLVLVALMWLGLLAQIKYERELLIETTMKENGSLARAFEEHVVSTISAAHLALRQIDEEYKKYGRSFDLEAYAQERKRDFAPFSVLSVVAANGDLMLQSVPIRSPQNFRKTDNFRHHLEHDDDDIYIGKARRGFNTGKWTIYLSRRINGKEGRFEGEAVVGIDAAYLSGLYEQVNLGKDSVVALAGRDGFVRARHSNETATAGEDANRLDLFTTQLPLRDHGSFIPARSLDGVPRIYSYRALKNYPLVVLVGTAEAVALNGFEQRKLVYYSWAAAMSIIILLFGALVTIQVLRQERSRKEILRLNAELEHRVGERTAELSTTVRELETAVKEMETFTYTVAHDLRAPVRAMNAYSNIVLEEAASNVSAESRGYLQRVAHNAQRMGYLIDDLLAFSRFGRQALVRQDVDMGSLAKSLVADQIIATGKMDKVQVRMGDLPNCIADPALMRQVFANLVSNALKYTGQAASPVIEIGHAEGAYFVRDNGVGFDMAYAGKLFGVFSRLHLEQDFEGTGVGLAIVKRIVERHGGRVWAQAAPGKGAAFFFTLGQSG
jgi:signal transduction histidine kinase